MGKFGGLKRPKHSMGPVDLPTLTIKMNKIEET